VKCAGHEQSGGRGSYSGFFPIAASRFCTKTFSLVLSPDEGFVPLHPTKHAVKREKTRNNNKNSLFFCVFTCGVCCIFLLFIYLKLSPVLSCAFVYGVHQQPIPPFLFLLSISALFLFCFPLFPVLSCFSRTSPSTLHRRVQLCVCAL
jgi:hypothetical protein